ncbi:metal transporter CNNM3 isoform X2 [Lynx canadensis]|uniref:metal transporter CNNM3 isoform X2 n=1 Tax=Lynx canadensis TaxID=61383 RepID=UPI0011B09510|nr:metal transporter CNNM3 isoform X2 [Lynx canadensis]
MAAAAAAGRLGWLLAALCLGNAAGEAASGPRVLGVCLEEDGAADAGWARGGEVRDASEATFRLRVFGSGLANSSWSWVAPEGAGCPEGGPAAAPEEAVAPTGEWRALLRLRAEAARPHSALLAVRGEPDGSAAQETAAPTGEWSALLRLRAEAVRVEPGGAAAEEAAPPWALGLGAAGLLALAALARGLQLSALALAPAEVQVLRESGSEAERAAARRLEPTRRWAGCALGALLLLASLAQTALAVLLYRAAGQRAVPAVLGSAGLVFLVGEVVPAAVSGRWALALAPRALLLSRLAVLLTLPVALPVGQLLELAARPGRLRERVLELARGGGDPYSDLSKGVLRCRTVEDVLTPLEDCFMLDASAVLDFGVLASIMQSGYTRIPVYEEERSNIVDMLYLKDLAFVDPEDCTPLSTITRFYNHPLHFVFNDTKLDAVLEEFKRGKSHLAIVQRVNNEGEGDPFYEVLGLVTLEDVIEEIIKSEILDESEDYRDATVRKKPASLSAPLRRKEEFSLFKVSDDEYKVKISPQLLLATQRFLSRGNWEPRLGPPTCSETREGSEKREDHPDTHPLNNWGCCFLLVLSSAGKFTSPQCPRSSPSAMTCSLSQPMVAACLRTVLTTPCGPSPTYSSLRSRGCSTSMHSWLLEPRTCHSPRRAQTSRSSQAARSGSSVTRQPQQQGPTTADLASQRRRALGGTQGFNCLPGSPRCGQWTSTWGTGAPRSSFPSACPHPLQATF